MKTITIVVALAAALAAGGFAWQKHKELNEARAESMAQQVQLAKSRADLAKMGAEVEVLKKNVAEQKMEADKLRAELTTAQAFLEAEKALGLRLREDLAKAKEQLASASRARPAQAAPARTTQPQPMVIQAPVTVIRAAPAGRAVGAGSPAQ